MLPLSSLYTWLFFSNCGFLRRKAIAAFPWQVLCRPRRFNRQYKSKPGAGTLQPVYHFCMGPKLDYARQTCSPNIPRLKRSRPPGWWWAR